MRDNPRTFNSHVIRIAHTKILSKLIKESPKYISKNSLSSIEQIKINFSY